MKLDQNVQAHPNRGAENRANLSDLGTSVGRFPYPRCNKDNSNMVLTASSEWDCACCAPRVCESPQVVTFVLI